MSEFEIYQLPKDQIYWKKSELEDKISDWASELTISVEFNSLANETGSKIKINIVTIINSENFLNLYIKFFPPLK